VGALSRNGAEKDIGSEASVSLVLFSDGGTGLQGATDSEGEKQRK